MGCCQEFVKKWLNAYFLWGMEPESEPAKNTRHRSKTDRLRNIGPGQHNSPTSELVIIRFPSSLGEEPLFYTEHKQWVIISCDVVTWSRPLFPAVGLPGIDASSCSGHFRLCKSCSFFKIDHGTFFTMLYYL